MILPFTFSRIKFNFPPVDGSGLQLPLNIGVLVGSGQQRIQRPEEIQCGWGFLPPPSSLPEGERQVTTHNTSVALP